jgi:hypothetical protein
VEHRTLVAIGAEIEAALVGRGDDQDKGDQLSRLAVRVARLLGAPAYDEKSPQRKLAAALFRWADAHQERFSWSVESVRLSVLGYIVEAAEHAAATSMSCGQSYVAALPRLETDPDWLADMAFLPIRGDEMPVSLTDVRDTIRYGMTAHGRLRDWLSPDKVESRSEQEAARLARFIGANDLRGMGFMEIVSRVKDALSEKRQEGAYGAQHR